MTSLSRNAPLVTASLIALSIALAAAAGCCDPPPLVHPSDQAIGRTADEQDRAAVEIRVVCVGEQVSIGVGSGVQVSDTGVLTASHVVLCPGEASVIVKIDGGFMPAIVRAVDYEADIALLYLLMPVPSTRVALGHRPLVGERVCLVTAMPSRARGCGRVDSLEALPGDVRHDVLTEAGNSGSGVYDASGRLVGVVTHRAQKTVGGLFSSLEDRAWMVRR